MDLADDSSVRTAPAAESLSDRAPPEMTSDAKPLEGVQIARACASLAVVVHHALEQSRHLFATGLPRWLVLVGASGVDVFFVVSGFIMLHTTWNSFDSPGATRRFLLRRAARIFPLYWFCIAVLLSLPSQDVLYLPAHFTRTQLLSSLTLLPICFPVYGLSWTLIFEMYFYLVFSGWLRTSRTRGILGTAASLILLTVLGSWFGTGPLRRFVADPIVAEFIYGLALAWLFRRAGGPSRLVGITAMVACCALLTLASWWAPRTPANVTFGLHPSVRFVLWGLPACLGVYASLGSMRRVHRVLMGLGDASYALYLTHGIVMGGYARLMRSTVIASAVDPIGWIVIAVAGSVVVGAVAHVCIEKPIAKMMKPWIAKVSVRSSLIAR